MISLDLVGDVLSLDKRGPEEYESVRGTRDM